MISCRDAHLLLSEALDRPLSAGERAALRLHTLLCIGCRNYRRQLALLRQACRRRASGEDAMPSTED